MATSDFIPDKFTLNGPAAPVWNTDLELDTSMAFSADASIHLLGTSAKRMYINAEMIPCAVGDVFVCEEVIRQDDITAGNTQDLVVDWYDKDQACLSTDTLFSGLLPAINTWYTISVSATAPADAGYAVLSYGRAAIAFDAWLDTLGMRKVNPEFQARVSSGTHWAAGTNKVHLDDEIYDHGNVFDAVTNHNFTVPTDGEYMVSFWGHLTTRGTPPNAGSIFKVILSATDDGSGSILIADGEGTEIVMGGYSYWVRSWSMPLRLLRGASYTLWIYHNITSDLYLETNAFAATQVGK